MKFILKKLQNPKKYTWNNISHEHYILIENKLNYLDNSY